MGFVCSVVRIRSVALMGMPSMWRRRTGGGLGHTGRTRDEEKGCEDVVLVLLALVLLVLLVLVLLVLLVLG